MSSKDKILDIGCGHQKIRNYLAPECDYTGLDYYKTAIEWYGSKPHVYADAEVLPFDKDTMKTVLLLDVLEHLPNPEICIREVYRVLQPGGNCIVQVPFLYPLHDEPLDFHRWTRWGLHKIFENSGFNVNEIVPYGKAYETGSLLFILGMCKSVLDWWRKPSLLLIISPLIIVVIPVINLIAALISIFEKDQGFMPYSYFCVLIKPD